MESNYLLEIGVEELPARLITSGRNQLRKNAEEFLKEERISYGSIEIYSTPRRLVLLVRNIGKIQEDLRDKVKGPSRKIAFTEDGSPSKALEGFLRGQGVGLEDIVYEEVKGVDYVYANILKKGRPTKEILEEGVDKLIRNINFPRSMKWGGKNIRFARPIRWIVSLLDQDIVDFSLEGIPVGRKTNGHRFLGQKDIEVIDSNDYFEKMKENFVIIDEDYRQDLIKVGAERLARERGGNLQEDQDLLDEVTNIVEYPTPLIGRIKEEYLGLPKEIVITPMKEHLRYFPVLDDKGRLLPYFITVRNGNDKDLDIVTKGNEKVLEARLEDAKFFYNEDKKRKLEDYVEDLKGIVFQEKLGSLYDKTMRIMELSEKIAADLELGKETEKNVQRAAYLSKADLVTKMVGEFAELQGIMGREYAMDSSEGEIVSIAIEEQYLPRFSGDLSPSTTAGVVLSIADKLDTICGLFAIGIQPTGSQDPFGLRRQALGIINIILNKKINLNLEGMIENSLYIYVEENELAFDYKKVYGEIVDFFNTRIRNVFMDMGIRYDIVDAVVGKTINNIYDLRVKAEKLSLWLEEDRQEILELFNRVANLACKGQERQINEEVLNDYELELYEAYKRVKPDVDSYLSKKDYHKALVLMEDLKEPIDNFFNNVMVMVDDEEIRNNRLALVGNIYDSMIGISDLSKIVSK